MSYLASFPDVATSFTYVDIPPPNNKIILARLADQVLDQASTTAPPSNCSSKTAYISQSRARHRAQITDLGSVITGSIEPNLPLIHLLNEIRGAKKDPEKADQRQKVEALLNLLEFSGKNRTFHLTSLENTLLLEPSLHADLDLYGLFCFTIPSDQRRSAILSLRRDNKDWANRAKFDNHAKRKLDLSKAAYRVTTIQVVVLHPSFQPNSMPLPILDPAARGATAAFSDWKLYFADIMDTGGLVDKQGNVLSIPWNTSRNDDEQLSLFALMVHSYSKLRSAREHTPQAPQFYDQTHLLFPLWEDMKVMMRLIFFVPPEVEAASSIMVYDPISAPFSTAFTKDSDTSAPTASTFAELPHPMDMDSNRAESLPSTLSSPTHILGLTMDSDDDDDEEEEEEDRYSCPDRQAPLTAAEVNICFSKASNGKLSSEERIESAMLLFGMAGSHPLPIGSVESP